MVVIVGRILAKQFGCEAGAKVLAYKRKHTGHRKNRNDQEDECQHDANLKVEAAFLAGISPIKIFQTR